MACPYLYFTVVARTFLNTQSVVISPYFDLNNINFLSFSLTRAKGKTNHNRKPKKNNNNNENLQEMTFYQDY